MEQEQQQQQQQLVASPPRLPPPLPVSSTLSTCGDCERERERRRIISGYLFLLVFVFFFGWKFLTQEGGSVRWSRSVAWVSRLLDSQPRFVAAASRSVGLGRDGGDRLLGFPEVTRVDTDGRVRPAPCACAQGDSWSGMIWLVGWFHTFTRCRWALGLAARFLRGISSL